MFGLVGEEVVPVSFLKTLGYVPGAMIWCQRCNMLTLSVLGELQPLVVPDEAVDDSYVKVL
jgi:hypothetical protein